MGEREPSKKIINRDDLYFLCHGENEDIFSGYGLASQSGGKSNLVGLFMIDRPYPADPAWLTSVESTFGDYQLVQMTATGERGILCQMQIEESSQPFLQKPTSLKADEIKSALALLLDKPPNPVLIMSWDGERQCWRSQIPSFSELPLEIREVYENFGYGCLAAETDIGVVHVCHAADADIDGFRNQPVTMSWQLIKMPTGPLIRLELTILDQPGNPYQFESFLNVADASQANTLAQLANQEQIYMVFYGTKLNYRFTKVLPHSIQQWQFLDELVMEAQEYWSQIPLEERDFNVAKTEFMRQFV